MRDRERENGFVFYGFDVVAVAGGDGGDDDTWAALTIAFRIHLATGHGFLSLALFFFLFRRLYLSHMLHTISSTRTQTKRNDMK